MERTAASPGEAAATRLPSGVSPVGRVLAGIVARREASLRKCDVVLLNWSRIVGAEHAARCRPAKLVRGTLTVRVADAVWLHEYLFLTPTIQALLDERVGAGVVKRIEWVQGRLPETPWARPERDRPPPALPARPLTPAEETAVGRAVANVSDPALRALFEAFGRLNLGRAQAASRSPAPTPCAPAAASSSRPR